MSESAGPGDIAVIGMALRFPGADSVGAFWENLCAGRESIRRFTDEELRSAGVAEGLLRDPAYVRAAAVLDGMELFDAAFFGISDHAAELMDPQQRLFLECAWEALEEAGCNPADRGLTVGVYAGAAISTYLLHNLHARLDPSGADFNLAMLLANDKDYLAPLVAYKLNLRGPAVSVQTACSSSLVAVHLACQALLGGECDVALAGGATVRVPHRVGYLSRTGGMLSPDGHCRAFDASAAGTVPGSGVGVVVLKRLKDARADGDCIHGVIKGSAVNNDGAGKVGFTAPSPDGQEQVIAAAHAVAGTDPRTIAYVEAHGTGTPLGDPIEMTALTRAFRRQTRAKQFCAIGSVKTNLGHLEAAAGIAGLIKTVLALEHRLIPPNLHFHTPNPEIDFADSPFHVNTALAEWPATDTPLRAGVSSFGFGGTNCHVVLEQAPVSAPSRGVLLPIHRFQRMRYWIDPLAAADLGSIDPPRPRALPGDAAREALPRVFASATGQLFFETEATSPALAFLWDHRIQGAAVFPASGYLECLLSAADRHFGETLDCLVNVAFPEMLFLPEPHGSAETRLALQVILLPEASGEASLTLFSRTGTVSPWTKRAEGRARSGRAGRPPAISLDGLRACCPEEVSLPEFFASLRERGIEYGPAFRGLRQLWQGENQAIGRVELPAAAPTGGFLLHPALLDACFQVVAALMSRSEDVFLPVGVDRLRIHGRPGAVLWSHATIRRREGERMTADFRLLDESGRLVAEIEGVRAIRPGQARPLSNSEGWLPKALAALPRSERRTALREHLRRFAARVLGEHTYPFLEPQESLRDFGLDSLLAVELGNLLAAALGRGLPSTVLFDHPSLAALTDYLGRRVFGWEADGRDGEDREDLSKFQLLDAIEVELSNWVGEHGNAR